MDNKTKNKLYHTSWNSSKIYRKIIDQGKIDTPSTQLHDRSHFWFVTGTSIKSGRAKTNLKGF
jgi:hypothetical protein